VEYPRWLCHEAGDCADFIELELGSDAGLSLHVEAQARPACSSKGGAPGGAAER
jgi:hypothetical protein